MIARILHPGKVVQNQALTFLGIFSLSSVSLLNAAESKYNFLVQCQKGSSTQTIPLMTPNFTMGI